MLSRREGAAEMRQRPEILRRQGDYAGSLQHRDEFVLCICDAK